jgi:hypothetical protein
MMKKTNLYEPIDEEEKMYINSIENDEWKEVKNHEKYKKQALKYSESMMKNDK